MPSSLEQSSTISSLTLPLGSQYTSCHTYSSSSLCFSPFCKERMAWQFSQILPTLFFSSIRFLTTPRLPCSSTTISLSLALSLCRLSSLLLISVISFSFLTILALIFPSASLIFCQQLLFLFLLKSINCATACFSFSISPWITPSSRPWSNFSCTCPPISLSRFSMVSAKPFIRSAMTWLMVLTTKFCICGISLCFLIYPQIILLCYNSFSSFSFSLLFRAAIVCCRCSNYCMKYWIFGQKEVRTILFTYSAEQYFGLEGALRRMGLTLRLALTDGLGCIKDNYSIRILNQV